jgi:glycosyltransferase involved in cell wall biosynthesis
LTTISVVIPTFNRPARLKACLEALARQRLAKHDFEVIVVDDGGAGELEALVRPLQHRLDVRLVRQQNTGPAGARNAGVAQAVGEFVAFTDDDCTPEEDWLSVFVQRLRQDPSRMYGGHTVNALVTNAYSRASQSLIDFLYGYYNADPDRARFFTSNNMAVPRNAFLATQGFDSGFPRASGEDRELCDRWLYLGMEMTYVPEAKVLHRHDLGFRSFCKQHLNYGRGAWHFRECKLRRGQKAPKFEPLAFYLGLVGHPWKKKQHYPLAISALMVVSQVANATGYALEKTKAWRKPEPA